jgi:hypothetical protein
MFGVGGGGGASLTGEAPGSGASCACIASGAAARAVSIRMILSRVIKVKVPVIGQTPLPVQQSSPVAIDVSGGQMVCYRHHCIRAAIHGILQAADNLRRILVVSVVVGRRGFR